MTGCDRAMAEIARRALADKDRLPKVKAWFHARGRRPRLPRGGPGRGVGRPSSPSARTASAGRTRSPSPCPPCSAPGSRRTIPAFLLAGLLEHDPGMWPKRVIVADARRRGVPVLPVDVNRSRRSAPRGTGRGGPVGGAARAVRGARHQRGRERTDRGRASRTDRCRTSGSGPIPAGRSPNASPRSAPSTPARRALTRRDLLLQIAELHRQSQHPHRRQRAARPSRQAPSAAAEPSGLPEMTGREALSAELDTLGIDVSQHLMEHHHRLLREIGATDAAHLAGAARRTARPGRRRARLHPDPADRQSGKRVIFVTLEDGSGLVDLAFFEDSHARVRAHRLPLRAAAGPRHRRRSAAPGAPSSAPWPGTWTRSPPPAATTARRPPSPSSAPTAAPTPASPAQPQRTPGQRHRRAPGSTRTPTCSPPAPARPT